MTPLETAAMHLQTAIAEIQPRDGLEPWLWGWMISHALADFCAEAGIDDIRGELAGLSDRRRRLIQTEQAKGRKPPVNGPAQMRRIALLVAAVRRRKRRGDLPHTRICLMAAPGRVTPNH